MYEYACTVLRVVDGDTLHLDVDLGCDVHTRLTIRLEGVDAPEISTEAGKAARAWVEDWLVCADGRQLTLTTTKDRREKYGRYLGTIHDDGRTLNADLIATGHAVPYAGGKR